ncbi:MAG: hypothetical protein H3C31_03150 [Brumimicrobium sp.]|nr:hypothetical protein [Brumimicrobium sp.]
MLKGNRLKYSRLICQGELNTNLRFTVYSEEGDRLRLINGDSLMETFKTENKEMKKLSFFDFKVKVNKVEDGIVYKYMKSKQIDTLKLEKGVYQYNKKLPIPAYFVFPIAIFNDEGRLRNFGSNFVGEYVKDSISFFADQYYEKMYIFHFYPTIYSDNNEEVLDTSALSTPIVIGISSVNGVPLYSGITMHYHEDILQIPSMACYTWLKIIGVTRKKMELILY